jgi:hypothetical protein
MSSGALICSDFQKSRTADDRDQLARFGLSVKPAMLADQLTAHVHLEPFGKVFYSEVRYQIAEMIYVKDLGGRLDAEVICGLAKFENDRDRLPRGPNSSSHTTI